MILYLLLTALTVGLAYFVNSEYRKEASCGSVRTMPQPGRQSRLNGVLVLSIFTVLFLLSALRIGIGNDYWTYRQQFLYIWGGDRKISFEIGFQYLVLGLQKIFGMDNYRVIFGVMAFLTCGFFMKGLYDVSDFFCISFFLFMANGFYFMSFSNVRYYFAMAVVLYSLKYFLREDYVKFAAWVIFAALFHKTALLVIPVYLVAYYLKWNKKTIWLVPAACAALAAGKVIIRRIIFVFYPFYEGDALFDKASISYLNILKCAAILAFALFFYKKTLQGDKKGEMFFNLNLFALVLYCFGTYIPELSRVCYYMVVTQIFLIPLILKKLMNTKWKYAAIPVLLAFFGYYLIFLERGKGDYVMILPYLTWVFT